MSKSINRSFKKWIQGVFGRLGLQAIRKYPYVCRVYCPPKRPERYLKSEYFAPTSLAMQTDTHAESTGQLYEIWRTFPGGTKWRHYFLAYESVLSSLGERPIRMLEIGVYKGASIRMWRKGLRRGSIVVGIDNNPDCKSYEDSGNKLHIRIGDQSDPIFLNEVVEEFGPFDFILDDGSHRCSHMIASFNHLFLDGLADAGVYMAEDIHCNFWKAYRDQQYCFIDLCKDLVNLIYSPYVEYQSEFFFRVGHASRVHSIQVPRIAAEIEEIRFLDSIVILKKGVKLALPETEHL